MMLIPPPPLSEFSKTQKTYLGQLKNVYRIGDRGRGIVLLHEIPGMTTLVLRLAKIIANRGYRVALPSLFGTDGGDYGAGIEAAEVVRMCVSAEFAVFAGNGSSPVVDWLRELCKDLASETGGAIGAVGLCITGGFALSLTVGTNGLVKAPVMSEPSLPFPVPFSNNEGDVHLSSAERDAIQSDAATPVMALRFTGDSFCKRARFDTYQDLLRGRFIRVEIVSPDLVQGIRSHAHAVLTKDLVDAPDNPTINALDRVLNFLDQQLG